MTSLQVKAESIRSALVSTSTCNAATVTLLDELLSTRPGLQPLETASNAKSSSKGASAPRQRTARAPKLTFQDIARQKDGNLAKDELSPKEKAILATEVINAALKALNSVCKAAPSTRPQPASFDIKDSPRHRVLRRSTSLPMSPLEQRSINRVSSSPNITTKSSRSSSASMTPSSYRAMAECAHIAFACMRSLQSSRTPCMMDVPPLQLENGMSALVGKLIVLGLDELAIKELRILKRRLDDVSKAPEKQAQNKKDKSGGVQTLSKGQLKETLVELLDFEDPPTAGAPLHLAVTTQLQVLKLLASSKKPSLITASLPKLYPDYESSPIRLLLQSAKESSNQATKAARQLETLSQLILSLCPNISTSDDSIAINPSLSTLPIVALQLQTLAFKSRLLWWELCDHQGDIENDILVPFLRCFVAFSRRCHGVSLETYQCASQTFRTIQSMIANHSYSQLKSAKSPLQSVRKLLGSLAQDAGCFDEAIYWFKQVQEIYRGAAISGVQCCALAASLVALKLLSSTSEPEVEELLMVVLEGIDGPLKGDNLELDELLSELSKARRAAISRLYKQEHGSDHNPTDVMSDGIRQMCESLILSCPRFSVRYLGKPPDSSSAPKVIVRYEQRRHFVARSGFHAIDSAMFLLKKIQSEGRLSWELMDSSLQDCLKLLERIEPYMKNYMDESAAPAASYFVRISQLYFTQHFNMRRDAEGPKDVRYVRPLRRSIACITNRSIPEKRAALLNSKLERLADICKTIGRYDEARETLISLQKELIESGSLSRIAIAGASKPFREAWQGSDDASMLARAMSSLVKLELKSGAKFLQVPFYDVNWSPQEKGLVLEHILDVLSKQPKVTSTVQRDIISELFAIYDVRKFTIRRLRIFTRILKLDQDQRRDLSEDVKSTLAVSNVAPILDNGEDGGLISYLPHLQALASTALELQEDHPRVDLLRPHLASWCSILDTVKGHESLTKAVDEVPEFLDHLVSIADFLHMKGFSLMRLAVLRMITNLNEILHLDSSPDDLVLSYNSLGLQYLELGYSGKAGLSFDRARACASRNGVTPEAQIQVQLSYAEYLLAIGNSEKCEEILMRAQALASQHPEIARPFKASGNLQRTTYLTVLAAYAFFVHSLLALERGAIGIALIHAKHSVKLIRCSWVKISMHLKAKITTPAAAESLAEDFTKLNVSISSPALTIPPHEQLPGPSAWALVGPLFRSLLHLSAIYSHNGMFQETIYYAEQAHKLVQLVDSGAYQATALTATGSTWLSAGKLDKASELFVRAKELGYSSGESKTAAILNLQLGRLHELLDNREATIAAYSHAHTILETMSSTKYISGIDRISNPAAELEEEISRLSLKPPKTNGPCKRVVSRKTQKRAATISKHTIETPSSISDECILLASLKGVLLRQRAGASMLWKQCEEAIAFLKEADAFSGREVDGINQNICIAKQLLQQSLEQLSADPVYSVLQDSTISFPAVVSSSRTAASTSEKPSGARLSPQAKRQGKSSNSGQQPPKSPSSTNFFDKLRLAQERLSEAHSATIQLSSTATIHTLSSLLCGISILISATGPSLGKFPVHLNTGVCSMETSRNIALQRERQTILDEQAYSQTDDEQRWPVLATNDHTKRKNELVPDPIRFQKQYVDIIPKEWTVISISLSSNRQELCLNKMQAGHSPFVLRLPLGRNNSRDVDEEVFDFDQGKAELLEIIELANDNSHGAKELTGRGAKTAWWAERDALNVRLRDLLKNIETVWLGGFRGIFSQHRPRPEILARFQKSFSNILDKHLPSRQNANKKCKNTRVTLDTRILELFIGLEEASAEDCNLDEALTDLLYFVVDILQFHGERNAYDEIDFDSIVIETHDALRSYQEAILAASTSREDKHTILILDKALHIFPWESLPCMEGLAVSRLPSLDCLRERILGLQISSASTGLNRQYIEATNGSYVLNPGGDLKTTQSTFESDLQGLNTWSGIIKREPTEAEMRDNLESKDIFLYFGHGSGAQYIRSKAIKRLRKCAVTMLMGCSSGALTESGEFEPYGPPVDYMLAGCPSLVATLWDVTDKDIDRFAKSTFEHWGLFGAQLARNEYLSKGKKMAGPFPVGREQKSLVKAVAEARKACNFRYLTAAAVCVYGIPVYLK